MTIANEVSAARTTFETLVTDLNPKGAGLATILAEERNGAGSDSYEFDAVGAAPEWEEWLGTKTFDGFREYRIACAFAKHHKSLALKRHKVVNDKVGTVGALMRTFMSPNDYLYDKLVINRLIANPTCLDQTPLISTTHPFGASGGTWSNKTTATLSHAAMKALRANARKLRNEKGEYIEVDLDTLIVNPDEEQLALEIAQADSRPVAVATSGAYTAGGEVGAVTVANVFKGKYTVVVTPRMPSGDYLALDSKRGKPIGLVVWRAPESVISDDMSGTHRQIHDEFLYSVEADVSTCGLLPFGIAGKLT